MTQRPWYPWYPNDYNRDTKDLSLEEDATYRILLDLAWENGGLPADQTRLRRLLPHKLSDPRKFKRLVLPILDRFFCRKGITFVQSRLEVERKSAEVRKEIGRTSSEKRWKNNGSGHAEAMLTIATATATEQKEKKPITNTFLVEGVEMTPLPKNWSPNEGATELSAIDRFELEKFRDYHLARGTLSANWEAEWRGWQRKEWYGKGYKEQSVTSPDALEARRIALQRLRNLNGGISDDEEIRAEVRRNT